MELIAYVRSNQAALLEEIRNTSALPDTTKLDSAIDEFKKLFSPSESSAS